MEAESDRGAFNPAAHPLTFTARPLGSGVYDTTPLSPVFAGDAHDPQEQSRSFEMGHATATAADHEEESGPPATIAVHTTTAHRAPPAASAGPSSSAVNTSPFTRRPERSAAVHVDPRRSHTVAAAAAAAARKKAEEEAAVEPLTAENETWGHWSFRHVFNGFIMMLAGFYQVVQAGARRQPVDMKTIEYTNSVYMSAPPRAEELEKQKQSPEAGSEHGSA